MRKLFNFSAGPAVLPEAVRSKTVDMLFSWRHRAAVFDETRKLSPDHGTGRQFTSCRSSA